MSTYTDLHNRIKENVTILRRPGNKDDGMTPQKVKFINPENQFYGTFNGKMNITSGILSGLKIIDSELENVELAGATVDGVSLRELKTQVEVNTQDIEQLQNDAKAISAAHDKLSSELSGTIDSLSIDINQKLDDTVRDIKREIGGVVEDVQTLSDDLNSLSGKVEALSTSMLNGVVYKGTLLLKQDVYDSPFELFKPSTEDRCCLVRQGEADEIYSNGWMYRIALDHSTGNIPADKLYVELHDLSSHGSDVWLLGEGDFIIIKNHDISKHSIKVGEITLGDLDRINAQDEDSIHESMLIKLSTDLSNEISATRITIREVSAEVLVSANAYTDSQNANYVHKDGDSIAKLSVDGTLDVFGNTTINNSITINDDFRDASGSKVEISKDKVAIETFAPISISSSVDANVNAKDLSIDAHEMSITAKHGLSIDVERGLEDINVNGTNLKDKLIDLVDQAGYLLSDDLNFDYIHESNSLRLSVQGNYFDVDVADIFQGKIINRVWVDVEDGQRILKIEFQVGDADPPRTEIIRILINDLFDPYSSGDGIVVDDNLCIHLSEAYRTQISNLQNYANQLSGPGGGDIGIINTLSDAIDNLITNQTQELMFGGLIEIDTADTSQHYRSVGEFLSVELGGTDVFTTVRNNSYFDVKFFHGLNISSVITTVDGLSVGDGDQIIIHEHNPSQEEEIKRIAWADLKVIDEHGAGNVYVIKAGVSRYEFEAEAKKRADDDDFISSWIISNFVNTGSESYSSTTTLRQEVSASQSLSVAANAYVFNDLSVAGQLFVNGAQLGITTEKKDPEDPTSEEKTVAKTVADEVEFTTSLDDVKAPAITINNQYITLRQASIDIDATSSFVLNTDGKKVIDATSSQIEILSVLSVETEKATITILSTGILSSDALTARALDATEKLSATSAYIDWLSVGQEKVRNIEVEDSLSIVSFSNLYAEDTGVSIAELCSNLSIEISGLSIALSDAIQDLSDSLSNEISTVNHNLSLEISSLTQKLYDELSVVEVDPLNTLNTESKISTVISAIVAVRDIFSSIREMLSQLL